MKGYYPHGPLQRVELGEYKVQGMDYAYTLQGWLKGINSDRLQPGNDMGQDGLAGTPNEFVGRDAFGESIGYFGDEDYKAIDATRWGGSPERPFAPVGTAGTLAGAYHPLYNGNIAHTVNSLQPWGGWTSPTQPAQVLAQVYKYDQLNRLKQAQGVEGLTAANTWNGITDAVADRYKSAYTYDANGNIETAKRYDETGAQYDNLEDHYEQSGTDLLRNRLYHLNESVNGGYGDIGVDGSAFHGAHADVNALNNYRYDALGNLIADKREEIANIEWTVSGKVKHITRTTGSTKEELTFTYGADGQRTSKTVGDPLNGGYREYYLRDAQGNIMAMYKYADNGASLKVTERPVYGSSRLGSSRLGSYTRQMELMGEPAIQQWPYVQPMQAPLKRYELTDHLGNVNTVVTGRLLPGNGAGSAKQAEVVSATGYESFGSLLPGRTYSSANYRFGFGGMPKDDEVYGSTGTSYDYGARLYDPRVGRWLSVDPMAHERSWLSPYNFVQNNPVNRIDPTGALDDWVQDEGGNIKWDKDANSQQTTKPGETYLGKTLTFNFNSYIDAKLWDGPGGSGPAGDKLTSTITLTGNENAAGSLTGLTATRSVKIGDTPLGTARGYFPGLGSDQNKFGFSGTQHQGGLLTSATLNFEQHASVSPVEQFGLNLLGYDIVNVAQNLQLSLSGNQLSVMAATDVFPSATLTMNGSQLMYYPQPSFKGTHGYQGKTVFGDNGMGGSTVREYTPLRTAPSFHLRYP